MTDPVEYLYEYDDFGLTKDGVLHRISTGDIIPWFKNVNTGEPWVPAKRKTFVSLIKGMVKEGDV